MPSLVSASKPSTDSNPIYPRCSNFPSHLLVKHEVVLALYHLSVATCATCILLATYKLDDSATERELSKRAEAKEGSVAVSVDDGEFARHLLLSQ